MLRKAVPLAGDYQVGDVVCFRMRPVDGGVAAKWGAGSRAVGFDGKNAWAITEGVPARVAADRLRPGAADEVLAHPYLSRHNAGTADENAPPEGQQQPLVDERRDLREPSVAQSAGSEQLSVITEDPWGNS